MQNQIYQFLSNLPLFSELPENDLLQLVENVSVETFPKNTILSVQGRTKLEQIYIIKDGSLELFYETNGERKLSGFLKPGESFGGVSVLMNAGISVRTAITVEDATLYTLPQKTFLQICERHNFFYDFFAARFHKQMSNEYYASLVASGQALHFLSHLVPFSFLPEEEINKIVDAIQMVHYPRNHVLFVQGQSKVESLYIIQKGAAERYYEEKNKKKLRGLLGEGDMYGGISLLLNNGVPIRTLRVTEDSIFFILPKEIFFDICDHHDVFSEFFTDTFGKRMLDRSYAEIISFKNQSI